MPTTIIEYSNGDISRYRLEFKVKAPRGMTAREAEKLINEIELTEAVPGGVPVDITENNFEEMRVTEGDRPYVEFDLPVEGTFYFMCDIERAMEKVIEEKLPGAYVDVLRRGYVCEWVTL